MGQSRREFIRCCSSLTLAGAASFSRLGLIQALAQTAPDYKALVCIFLFGGNDSNNMIVPMDSTTYQTYFTARGGVNSQTSGLALPQAPLLPIQPTISA